MKKLLNNPFVIAILVIGATYVIYANIVQPLLGSGESTTAAMEDVIDPMMGPSDMSGGQRDYSGSSSQKTAITFKDNIDLEGIDKDNIPSRDPFRFPVTIRSLVSKGESLIKDQIEAKPHLSAIIASQGLSYAVIDGEIVSVGDVVGKYVLSKIDSDNVTIEGAEGPVKLQVEAFPLNSGETNE